MGTLSRLRGVKFYLMALNDITWLDGRRVQVPAGTVGAAVLSFGGRAPGYLVEWERGGVCSISMADEGKMWLRVARPRSVVV